MMKNITFVVLLSLSICSYAQDVKLKKHYVDGLIGAVLSSHESYKTQILSVPVYEEYLLPYFSSVSLILSFKLEAIQGVNISNQDICGISEDIKIIEAHLVKNEGGELSAAGEKILNSSLETSRALIGQLDIDCDQVLDGSSSILGKFESWRND